MKRLPTAYRTTMNRLDTRLRSEASPKMLLLLVGMFLAALVIRFVAIRFISVDFSVELFRWTQYIRNNGFGAFRDNFYNYNPPYVYFLGLASALPVSNVVVVKIVSLFFDLVLAGGVMAVTYHWRKNLYGALMVGTVMLLLPEVFLNSGFWGQVDAGYTGLIVWAAFFFMRNKQIWGWVFFATAVAFKAQALFLFPAILVIFVLKRHHIISLLVALVTFLAWDIPCVIAGRSTASLAGIYFAQVGTFRGLSLHAPNFYFFISDTYYDMVRNPALLIGALLTFAAFVILFVRRDRLSQTSESVFIIRMLLLFSILVPFVLPQMHERYFYPAGIFALLLTVVDRRYLVPAIMIQVANVLAYVPFLFGSVKDQFPYLPGTNFLVGIGVFPEFAALIWIIYLTFKPVEKVRGLFQREAAPAPE